MKGKLVCGLLLAACVIMAAGPVLAAGDSTEVRGTVPLVIYDVSITDLVCTGATILWKTNGAATSQVFYDKKSHANIADYAYHTSKYTTPVSEHSVQLTGLCPSITYHHRVKSVAAVNGSEFTAISEDYTLTTLPAHRPPSMITVIGLPLGPKSAILWSWLTHRGAASSVEVYFHWGKTTAYGFETRHQTLRYPGLFFATITNLTPGTRYHFRAVAVGDGTDYGRDMSFITWKR